jgi:hypothetical protein
LNQPAMTWCSWFEPPQKVTALKTIAEVDMKLINNGRATLRCYKARHDNAAKIPKVKITNPIMVLSGARLHQKSTFYSTRRY